MVNVTSRPHAKHALPPDDKGPARDPDPFKPKSYSPYGLFVYVFHVIYYLVQIVIAKLFAPTPPPEGPLPRPYGRIAIVGAGISGVSTAAHARSHNFDVVIFEASDRVGGIWSQVNKTSGLQIDSILYRWHPSVLWQTTFPRRDEILSQVDKVVATYGLKDYIRLNTKVEKVTRHESSGKPDEKGHAKWIINDGKEGIFDAIVVTVGTCGEPNTSINFPGQDNFKGKVVHSASLDGVDLANKKVVVLGSGASGIEALELAVAKGAKTTTVLARSDKWMIPRNLIVDTLLALQPLGRETLLTPIIEWFLRTFHYRDLSDKVSPQNKPFYSATPICNSSALDDIRTGKADYLRGDILEITSSGVKFNKRPKNSKKGDDGEEIHVDADVLVLATGFKKPSVGFLPDDLFPESEYGDYHRPNLYLQNFTTGDWSVLLTNSAYVDAVGTVGHVHIGIYARILMLFLIDKSTRPIPKDMRLWVDVLRWLKRKAPGGALSFFTYMELCIWFVEFHLFNLRTRTAWIPFTLLGFGVPVLTKA